MCLRLARCQRRVIFFFFSESKFSFHPSTLLDGITVLSCFQSNVKSRRVTNKKRLTLWTASYPVLSCFVAGCWGSCYTLQSFRSWKARSYFTAHRNSRAFVLQSSSEKPFQSVPLPGSSQNSLSLCHESMRSFLTTGNVRTVNCTKNQCNLLMYSRENKQGFSRI